MVKLRPREVKCFTQVYATYKRLNLALDPGLPVLKASVSFNKTILPPKEEYGQIPISEKFLWQRRAEVGIVA